MNRRDTLDALNLGISAASLGVGIVALCLNEKGEKMANRIDSSKYSSRKDLKKAYAKEIKRAAVSEIGYTGTVIVLNEKGEQKAYGLVALEDMKAPAKAESSNKGAWVAMEINSRSGGDRQAIVCSSKNEAKNRALGMKNAHRKGSKQSKDCIQGYAKVDTSESIDVAKIFNGKGGTVYRV